MTLRADGAQVGHVGIEITQIVARGEVVAVGGQHDAPDVVVARGNVERLVHLGDHEVVLGVGHLGACECDPRHPFGGSVVADVLPVGHADGASTSSAFQSSTSGPSVDTGWMQTWSAPAS